MITVPRTISLTISAAIAVILGIAVFAAPASAGNKCNRLPLSVKLSSHDPTALLEKAQAWVYVRTNGNVNNARVKVIRSGVVYLKHQNKASVVVAVQVSAAGNVRMWTYKDGSWK